MVFTRPLISKTSSPYTKPLVTVPSAPITVGITVSFRFHNFFSPLARSRHLYLFSLTFSFILLSAGAAKSTIRQDLFFFVVVVDILKLFGFQSLLVFHTTIRWQSFMIMLKSYGPPCPLISKASSPFTKCREEENLVFCFGAQFNSTLNFTQSG